MGRRKPARTTTVDTTKLATVKGRGKIQYAQEFVEVVVQHAMKHGQQDAAEYYDMPRGTISRWVKVAEELNEVASKRHAAVNNPYRGTQYTLERRMNLSDKLFAELEFTLEAEKVRNGYVSADILKALVTSFRDLTDKRRLEEGAHTALVQAVKAPEEIYEEGEAKVVEFRQRAALPPGS